MYKVVLVIGRKESDYIINIITKKLAEKLVKSTTKVYNNEFTFALRNQENPKKWV